MIIYARSFSNPSVGISHDAKGLSAVCDCGISLRTHLLFLTRILAGNFSYTCIGRTVLLPWRPVFFHQIKKYEQPWTRVSKGPFVQNFFQI